MNINYYQYPPPYSNELQSMFYKVTTVDVEATRAIKHIFLDPVANPARDVMLKHTQQYRLYSMAKPAIAIYGYYINNPQQFNHDPNNIVSWMLLVARNILLDYDNYNGLQKEFMKLPNKFVSRHKDFLLRTLERDARIVAAKADHIESQRKH